MESRSDNHFPGICKTAFGLYFIDIQNHVVIVSMQDVIWLDLCHSVLSGFPQTLMNNNGINA